MVHICSPVIVCTKKTIKLNTALYNATSVGVIEANLFRVIIVYYLDKSALHVL